MSALVAVFVVLSCSMASLWENPPGGRTPRQRPEGIFHRLLRWFFVAFCWLTGILFHAGAPHWLINLLRWFVPDVLMRASARAWQSKQEQKP